MRDVPWTILGLPALVSSEGLEGAVMMTARQGDPGKCRFCELNVCGLHKIAIEILTPSVLVFGSYSWGHRRLNLKQELVVKGNHVPWTRRFPLLSSSFSSCFCISLVWDKRNWLLDGFFRFLGYPCAADGIETNFGAGENVGQMFCWVWHQLELDICFLEMQYSYV